MSWLFETAAILAPAIVAMIALRDHERKVFSCAMRKDHVAASLSACSARRAAAKRTARADAIGNRCPNRNIDAWSARWGAAALPVAGWLGGWVAGWLCLIAICYQVHVATCTTCSYQIVSSQ